MGHAMQTLKQALSIELFHIGAIQFGHFQLKSGQWSPIYINLRKIIAYPQLLRRIAEAMWVSTQHCTYDLICGVPYTALPIATCISLDHNIPMIMRRKEKKDYGTKQSIEGVYQAGQRCLIIEDVVTSGGSLIETATELQQAGLVVDDVIALIDREQGGRNNLRASFRFHHLLTLTEIFALLLAWPSLPTSARELITQCKETLVCT